MKRDVIHLPELQRFIIVEDGETAYAEYAITDGADGKTFDVVHTIVPEEIKGRGIASELVEAAYRYAGEQGMKYKASCSYASNWLLRNMM